MPRWFLTSEASIRYLQSSTQQVQQKDFFKLLELARRDTAQAAQKQSGVGWEEEEGSRSRSHPHGAEHPPLTSPNPAVGSPPPFVGPRGCPAPSCCWLTH